MKTSKLILGIFRILSIDIILIIIAILSGVVINLITSQSITYFFTPIIGFIISILILVLLLFLNKKIIVSYNSKKRQYNKDSDDTLWEKAIDETPYRKFYYLILCFSLFLTMSFSSNNTIASIKNLQIITLNKEIQINKSLTDINNSILSLKSEINIQNSKISNLNDSVTKLIRIQSVERPRQNNK